MDKLNPKSTLRFIELITRLKHTSRKGWEYCHVANHEKIAGHMYAMAMMTFFIDDKSSLNRNKCMQLALVHDLAESIVGDITPRDNVPADVKHRMEMDAMGDLSNMLGGDIGHELLSLYKEYAAKETEDAKFVKDLDRFDMIFTANYYEKRDNTPKKLQEFFDSTDGKIEHPFIKKLVEEMEKERPKRHEAKNKKII